VSLASFDLGSSDTAVKINWKTSYEYAIDYFTIEKSKDGVSYSPLGNVNSRWTSASILEYLLNDARPASLKNHYRISAITIYGEKLVLNEKSILYQEKAKMNIKNLAERIEVNITSNMDESISLMLFDMQGRAIKTQRVKKDIYSIRTTVDMQELPRGSYILRVLSPTINTSKQVIRL
jgi:hypothetical protein